MSSVKESKEVPDPEIVRGEWRPLKWLSDKASNSLSLFHIPHVYTLKFRPTELSIFLPWPGDNKTGVYSQMTGHSLLTLKRWVGHAPTPAPVANPTPRLPQSTTFSGHPRNNPHPAQANSPVPFHGVESISMLCLGADTRKL